MSCSFLFKQINKWWWRWFFSSMQWWLPICVWIHSSRCLKWGNNNQIVRKTIQWICNQSIHCKMFTISIKKQPQQIEMVTRLLKRALNYVINNVVYPSIHSFVNNSRSHRHSSSSIKVETTFVVYHFICVHYLFARYGSGWAVFYKYVSLTVCVNHFHHLLLW